MEQELGVTTETAIEQRTRKFLRMLNSGDGPPIEELTPEEARAVLTAAQESAEVDTSGIDVEEKTIQMDDLSVNLVIVRPAGVQEQLPAFMFFHGGGWVLGDFPTHKRFIRDLVVYSGAAAVYVDYSRAPEARYPIAINQAYAATRWIAAHGAEVNLHGDRLAVVGNSAGGNLAAVVALMAKENNGPAIRFQVLLWPVTDSGMDTLSYHRYANGRFLTANMMQWFWDSYMPVEERQHPHASPLNAEPDQLEGLPPALVQTAENDVLRDEGEAYARRMSEAGVDVTLVRIQGMIHDYGLLNPLATIPAVQSALRHAAGELKNALR